MSYVNSYDGFIFDYGKVLVTDQTEGERLEMARLIGLSQEDFSEAYWKDRLDYDKGLLTGVDYWRAVGSAAKKELTAEQISRLVDMDSASWMHFDEPMWRVVQELRARGKRVAVLSNMPRDLGETLRSSTRRFEGFDHVTLSFEVRSVKPEPEIYEECLMGLGTAREKAIFFDDKVENVRGAEMLGLDAVEFSDRAEFLRALWG